VHERWVDGARLVGDAAVMNDRASHLGAAVRSRREHLGLTQVELAELASVSTRFVHMLETGKPSVRLDKTLDVLGVLGLELRVGLGRGQVVAQVEGPGRSQGGTP